MSEAKASCDNLDCPLAENEGQRAAITEKGCAYLAEKDQKPAPAATPGRWRHRSVRLTEKGLQLLQQLDSQRSQGAA